MKRKRKAEGEEEAEMLFRAALAVGGSRVAKPSAPTHPPAHSQEKHLFVEWARAGRGVH